MQAVLQAFIVAVWGNFAEVAAVFIVISLVTIAILAVLVTTLIERNIN